MATEKNCPGCQALFTITPTHRWYCSACAQGARDRVCRQCKKSFQVKAPSVKGIYCSRACQGISPSQIAPFLAAAEKRSAEGWVLVPCAAAKLGACSHPQDLVRQERAAATRQGKCHPECLSAFNHARVTHNTGTAAGQILYCQNPECGKNLGYHSPASVRPKHCAACKRKAQVGRARPKVAQQRACPVCGTLIKVTPSRIKMIPNPCCSPACREAWKRTKEKKQAIRCTGCGAVRRPAPAQMPRTVDRETMTWTCLACRGPAATAWQQRTCAHCQKSYRARIRVAKPENFRFCSIACKRAHYIEARRRRGPCAQCGGPIKRRGANGKYCSRACDVAARQGRPHPRGRPSPAEVRVLEQWAAGVRGVRPLARAAGVADTTVRNLKAAGKLVEPVAVARSA